MIGRVVEGSVKRPIVADGRDHDHVIGGQLPDLQRVTLTLQCAVELLASLIRLSGDCWVFKALVYKLVSDPTCSGTNQEDSLASSFQVPSPK